MQVMPCQERSITTFQYHSLDVGDQGRSQNKKLPHCYISVHNTWLGVKETVWKRKGTKRKGQRTHNNQVRLHFYYTVRRKGELRTARAEREPGRRPSANM